MHKRACFLRGAVMCRSRMHCRVQGSSGNASPSFRCRSAGTSWRCPASPPRPWGRRRPAVSGSAKPQARTASWHCCQSSGNQTSPTATNCCHKRLNIRVVKLIPPSADSQESLNTVYSSSSLFICGLGSCLKTPNLKSHQNCSFKILGYRRGTAPARRPRCGARTRSHATSRSTRCSTTRMRESSTTMSRAAETARAASCAPWRSPRPPSRRSVLLLYPPNCSTHHASFSLASGAIIPI